MATTETSVTCPFDKCEHKLLHHDVLGVRSPTDPLHIEQTTNVYECQEHGLLAYKGNRQFEKISN